MEQQREVMRRVLGLADTTLEGLRHIQQRQLKGHHPDETTTLFADVVHAFAEIEEAIHRGLPPLDTGDLVAQTNTLREGLHWMTAAYEVSRPERNAPRGCADVFLDFMKPHLDSHDTPSDSSRLETS